MILRTCVDHDPRWTSIEFGVKKIKGQGHIWTLNFLLFSHDFLLKYNDVTSHVLTMTQGRPLLILGPVP